MQKLPWKANTKLDRAGLEVIRLFQVNDFQAFWVGGAVRNILLHRDSDNIDIATDAQPSQIEELLEQAKIKYKPVGRQFGSILAIVDGHKIEITTFRAEGRYSDQRHPDRVEFIKDYLQDAKRRDFTVNALYFDPVKKELYDPTGGIKDLGLRLLRFVGDPKKRIDEDALRMLRGVRLATQLGFKLEKNSFAAIKTRAKYIQGISGERVKSELDRILISEHKIAGILLLDDIGLLKFILPELSALKNFNHNSTKFHLEGDLFEHVMKALGTIRSNDLDLIYSVLFHDIGKPLKAKEEQLNGERVLRTRAHADAGAEVFREIAERLKFSGKSERVITWLIRKHMMPLRFMELNDRERAELILHPDFGTLLRLSEADDRANIRLTEQGNLESGTSRHRIAAEQFFKASKAATQIVEKLAKGNLIIKYSRLKPGPALGQKISEVKTQIILGEIKNETDLKNFLQKSSKNT